MIFVFDLDYTLLDTEKFKKALAKAAGLSYNKWVKQYEEIFKSKKINYNLEISINELVRSGLIKTEDKKNIIKESLKVVKKIDNFIFKDSEAVLQSIKEKKHKLFLVTFGDKIWHRRKVNGLRIKKYFDRIIYQDSDKNLGFLNTKEKRIILVNDNAGESLRIKKAHPKVEVFLVKGPYSNNCEHELKMNKLTNILQLINVD